MRVPFVDSCTKVAYHCEGEGLKLSVVAFDRRTGWAAQFVTCEVDAVSGWASAAAGGDEPGMRIEEHAIAALVRSEGGAQLVERVLGARSIQWGEEIFRHLQSKDGVEGGGGVGSVADGLMQACDGCVGEAGCG